MSGQYLTEKCLEQALHPTDSRFMVRMEEPIRTFTFVPNKPTPQKQLQALCTRPTHPWNGERECIRLICPFCNGEVSKHFFAVQLNGQQYIKCLSSQQYNVNRRISRDWQTHQALCSAAAASTEQGAIDVESILSVAHKKRKREVRISDRSLHSNNALPSASEA